MIATTSKSPSNARHLALGTLSFAISFAVWGLISAFAPRFRELFSLSGTQTALLIAVPVILMVVVLLASYIPACRAARVNPIVALRREG